MNIMILAGSFRRGSWTVQVAKELRRLAPVGVEVELHSGLEALPFYSQDLDAEDVTLAPAQVAALRASIHRAEAMVVVTPEYNGSLPGVLKNAIDWASRPRGASSLDDLPVTVVGVSPSPGGARGAGADAVKILKRAGARVTEIPISIASVYRVLDEGSLADADLEASLMAMLNDLTRPARGEVSSEDDAA